MILVKRGWKLLTERILNKQRYFNMNEREERKKAYYRKLRKEKEPKAFKLFKGLLMIALIAFLALSFLVSLSNPLTWVLIALSLLVGLF